MFREENTNKLRQLKANNFIIKTPVFCYGENPV
jgi:hypothetical protein